MNTKGWQETPSQEKWQALLQEALALQKCSELQKVVLSRQSHKTLKDPICPFATLRHLKKHQNKTTVFFLQLSKDITFLGSTPEKLFEREGQNLYSEALAGTIKNGDTPSYQQSLKLQREVEAVETYIERTLAPLSTKISKDKCFSLLPLNTITHLHKKISVELLPFCTDEDIIEALHPTPAVAGTRKDLALSYIRERENHDRGYYAGVIGWIGYNRADISVAIRSCLIRGRDVFIYAGAGIVSGSDPSSEWQELERKTAQYKEFFCEH
jgi:isochorismate synthase